ncbi:hypothetical protein B0H19DRAFT_1075744 [Mycena capillaripes]|nr:hypothetical protein B0H19DRAFT_1075744 [Mycena capillaripes]
MPFQRSPFRKINLYSRAPNVPDEKFQTDLMYWTCTGSIPSVRCRKSNMLAGFLEERLEPSRRSLNLSTNAETSFEAVIIAEFESLEKYEEVKLVGSTFLTGFESRFNQMQRDAEVINARSFSDYEINIGRMEKSRVETVSVAAQFYRRSEPMIVQGSNCVPIRIFEVVTGALSVLSLETGKVTPSLAQKNSIDSTTHSSSPKESAFPTNNNSNS